MLRARGRRGGIEVWSSGALEVYRRRVDVEVLRSGDAPQACRCGDVEAWNSGAMEVAGRHVDVEV